MIGRRNPFEMMWRDTEDLRAEPESLFHAVHRETDAFLPVA